VLLLLLGMLDELLVEVSLLLVVLLLDGMVLDPMAPELLGALLVVDEVVVVVVVSLDLLMSDERWAQPVAATAAAATASRARRWFSFFIWVSCCWELGFISPNPACNWHALCQPPLTSPYSLSSTHSTLAPSERRFSAKRGCARRMGVALWMMLRPGMLAATISSAMATRMM
jgi:hypothetical protein